MVSSPLAPPAYVPRKSSLAQFIRKGPFPTQTRSSGVGLGVGVIQTWSPIPPVLSLELSQLCSPCPYWALGSEGLEAEPVDP